MLTKLLRDVSATFDVTGQLLIIFKHSSKNCKRREYNLAVRQLFIYLKKAYDSGTRKIVCNILLKFDTSMGLLILVKMHLNKPSVKSL